MSKAPTISPKRYAKAGYTISTDTQLLDISRIYSYLSEESYWAQERSREQVERSIRHSLCFGVYTAGADLPRQVGFARVVSDFATFAYLADVFILPEYQGQGLGKWLVATMVSHPDLRSVGRWMLYTEDAHELYRRFGFDTEENPWRFMSYRPYQLEVEQQTD